MRRICASRSWKLARSIRLGPTQAPPVGPVRGPLFQGTVYLANLQLTGPGGPWSISAPDLSVVQSYLSRIVGPISRYASQYGPVRLVAGAPLPALSAAVSQGRYTDHQLQAWVAQIVQSNRLPPTSALLLLNPPGVVNEDAKESGGVGVLGYHGVASIPYSFVNALGSGFTPDDRADLYAEAVSHEIAEMTVDPRANDSNPEVCDGCGTNCLGTSAYRAYFDANGNFQSSGTVFPPPTPYAFFISSIAQPPSASDCPAPGSACAYPPPA
jgi:hypothetical protein